MGFDVEAKWLQQSPDLQSWPLQTLLKQARTCSRSSKKLGFPFKFIVPKREIFIVEGDLKFLTTRFLRGAWLLIDTVGMPPDPSLASLKFSSPLPFPVLVHAVRQLGCHVTFHR